LLLFGNPGNGIFINCIYKQVSDYMNIAEHLEDARAGSAAAQKALFDHLADPMMALCCRYVKNRADAEELLLDGFYKFFTRLRDFRYQGEAALYAWVRTIMVRECLMFLRRRRAFSMLSAEQTEPADAAADTGPDDEPLAVLSAAEIFDLVVRLPVGYRTVFNLHVIEGFEHKEIARSLGISEGTSKSQLSKSKVLLRKMLGQKGIDYVKRKSR
jgi:RNA polymerase sigma factor (sigma-70 family)